MRIRMVDARSPGGELDQLGGVIKAFGSDERLHQESVDVRHEEAVLVKREGKGLSEPLLGRFEVVARKRVLAEPDEVLDLEERLARPLQPRAVLLAQPFSFVDVVPEEIDDGERDACSCLVASNFINNLIIHCKDRSKICKLTYLN